MNQLISELCRFVAAGVTGDRAWLFALIFITAISAFATIEAVVRWG